MRYKNIICILFSILLMVGCTTMSKKESDSRPTVAEIMEQLEGSEGKWSAYDDMGSGTIADEDTFLVRDVSDATTGTGYQWEYPWSVMKADISSNAWTFSSLATFNGGLAGLGRWDGDLSPDTDATDSLGSATYGWLDLYVTNSIELGHDTDNTLTASSGVLSIQGTPLAPKGISTVTDPNGFTMSAAQCLAGVVAYATGAGTIVMCPVLATSSFTVIDYGGAAIVLDPDATGQEDRIILDGTLLDVGANVTSTSTTGDMITCIYNAADIWYCASGSPDGDHWTGP